MKAVERDRSARLIRANVDELRAVKVVAATHAFS